MHDSKFVGTTDTAQIRNLRDRRGCNLALIFVCQGCCNQVPQMGGLNKRNLLSHSSGGWESEIKMSAGLVPSEGHKGTMCPRLVSLAYTQPSLCVLESWPTVSVCPDFLFKKGHSAKWLLDVSTCGYLFCYLTLPMLLKAWWYTIVVITTFYMSYYLIGSLATQGLHFWHGNIWGYDS